MTLRVVIFRGEEVDVEVDVDGGYEPDTGAHVIEWHFYGLTPEQNDALNITEDEELSVYEQLVVKSGDDDDYYDPAEWRD